MAENGTLIIEGEGDLAKFVYAHTTSASGDHVATLATKNNFVDKDIEIDITTPAAATPSLNAADSTDALTMGSASGGYFYPTATVSGNMNVATAGWITSGNHAVSDSGVQVGKVAQSTLANGSTAISSGAEIIAGAEDQTINISAGYEGARTVIVKSSSSSTPAEVSSSNATISSLTYTADDSNLTFDISGTQTIAAPTVNTAGYISSSVGTKNSGTATVDTTVAQVKVGVTVTGTAKVTPVIARTAKPGTDTWVDAAGGSATTTKPNSGAYIRVDAEAKTSTISSVGKVVTAGYGTTDHYQYDAATSTTVGSNAASSTYIPVQAGTVASGTATISSVSFGYNSTGGNFDITGSANIPAPTVSTAGYVGNGIGTLSGATSGAAVSTSVAKIGIQANLSGTGTYKPSISKNAATNIAADTATTTQPSSGYYVAVSSAANTSTVQATASVSSAGYGTTTSGQYTTTPSSSLTVGASASDLTYIPIPSGSLANAETSGQSYTDLSSSGPVLISGSYLYINKGYFANSKISLARLVPDAASSNLASTSMLDGFSAYNNDGTLITGTIPTYDGSYSVA